MLIQKLFYIGYTPRGGVAAAAPAPGPASADPAAAAASMGAGTPGAVPPVFAASFAPALFTRRRCQPR